MADYTAKDIMALRERTQAGIGLCKEALESSSGDMEKAVAYINEKSDVANRIYQATGAKLGLIKLALKDAEGDYEGAVEIIKERGWEGDVADVDAVDAEGGIGSYIHGTDRKTAALVEVHCSTDFVANNENFIEFINELAKQAAAMKPKYVSRDDVPEEVVKEKKELFQRELEEEGKPEKIWDQIIEGKFNKFYQQVCLLEQKWFKNEEKTMLNLLEETQNTLGESLDVTRLTVWELGKK